jgi:RNA polymerase sigma factor (sigma-70 family)
VTDRAAGFSRPHADVRPGPGLDEDLVARLRQGDASAFDTIYERYEKRLFSFLVRLSGEPDVAQDLAQETWMKLAQMAPALREDTALATLLFTIARNAFISHRRWAMLDVTRLVTFGMALLDAEEPSPESRHEDAQAIASLERALAALPFASREVLLLTGVEGMAQDEVAHVLGISYDAVRQRLSRARKELAAKMEAS